jgi:hypothetical protein
MLLAAVIERVVILPSEPGKRRNETGRALSIQWKPSAVEPPPRFKGVKGTGRAKVLARTQLRAIRANKEARAERLRAYYREWKEVMHRLPQDG